MKAHNALAFEAEVREYDGSQARVAVNSGSGGIGLGLAYVSGIGNGTYAALTPEMARRLGQDLIERADELDPPAPEEGPRQLRVKISVSLDNETLENLIDAAGYGMNDWCRKAVVDPEKETYTVYPLHDDVDGEKILVAHVLTYDRIRDAIAELWDLGHLPDWFEREIRDGDIAGDAMVGSNIIQQAAFREVIFG